MDDASAGRDRDELLELLARYTDMPDRNDWDDLPLRVFAEEVEWDFTTLGLPRAVVRRDELREQLRGAFAGWKATLHLTSAHQVRIDGDRATIHAKIRAEHWLPAETAGDGPDRWLVVGFYDDEAVRTADGWRLSKAKLTVTHSENDELHALGRRRN